MTPVPAACTSPARTVSPRDVVSDDASTSEECKNNSSAKNSSKDDDEEQEDLSSPCCWSLSIKPVGVPERSDAAAAAAASSSSAPGHTTTTSSSTCKDFVIEVCPDDDLAALYDRIERVTGLRASQQRLIYRGQLIGGGGSSVNKNGGSGDGVLVAATEQRQHDGSQGAASGSAPIEAKEGTSGAAGEQRQEGTDAASAGSTMKIKDIRGLSDGHTIHLVRKREQPQFPDTSDEQQQQQRRTALSPSRRSAFVTPNARVGRTSNAASEQQGAEVLGGAGVGAAPLLAALLGLGDDRATDANADQQTQQTTSATPPSSRRHRPAASSRLLNLAGRSVAPHRRSANHRLTADDLTGVPDPGSLEAIRQGMMTLHTMLPHAPGIQSASSARLQQPPPHHRQWYVGQWIDCLDTVNQWLEATIIEIAAPDDVLPPEAAESPRTADELNESPSSPGRGGRGGPAADVFEPIVSASDLVGRRRLLVEPCDPEEVDERNDLGGDLAGYKRRRNDQQVRLLLVHYNGWPHRWDEWIRSDSPRIRPFRVRTRHPTTSPLLSPTPQSTYAESPSTHMVRTRRQASSEPEQQQDDNHDDEYADRAALLPELRRVMDAVNGLVSSASAGLEGMHSSSAADNRNVAEDSTESNPSYLPWVQDASNCRTADSSGDPASSGANPPTAAQVRRELEALAPLLDRLGRTLVDAAPHVAALSRSAVSPATAATRAEPPDEERNETPPTHEDHPTSLGGLLSLLGRDRRRQSNASSNVVVPSDSQSAQDSVQASDVNSGNGGGAEEDEGPGVDPDLSDLVFGPVNTTRGEIRRGPRSRQQVTDDAASLLGTYLAAASLGSLVSGGGIGIGGGDADDVENSLQGLTRMLRERGSGGGIDIHIHAVVTSPGALPLGLTTIAAGSEALNAVDDGGVALPGRSPIRSSLINRPSAAQPLRVVTQNDDDDDGIFSDLYSETPAPVDPSRPSFAEHVDTIEPPPHPRPRSVSSSVSASSRVSNHRVGSNGNDRSSASSRTGVERSHTNRRSSLLSRIFRRNATTDN